MKLLLSFDYEMYFGRSVGTVRDCLIEPTEALLRLASSFGVRIVLFVDATFLLRLREEAGRHRELGAELDCICAQLVKAVGGGHDVQLHTHPHWIDSWYDGQAWQLSLRRYRLQDFAAEERRRILGAAKQILEEVVGRPVFAFRAGGWCIQPFGEIRSALRDAGLWLDSTVYAGGVSSDPGREHDFRRVPQKALWRFGEDPGKEAADGEFVEIPISSFRASPLMFWKLTVAKRAGGALHRASGCGEPIRHGAGYYLGRLLLGSHSAVSVDGIKAGELPRALSQHLQHGNQEVFHVMGHPKSLTPYSLKCLEDFLRRAQALEPATMQCFAHLKPARTR